MGLGFGVWGLGFRGHIKGYIYIYMGLGFRVWGLGFRGPIKGYI